MFVWSGNGLAASCSVIKGADKVHYGWRYRKVNHIGFGHVDDTKLEGREWKKLRNMTYLRIDSEVCASRVYS